MSKKKQAEWIDHLSESQMPDDSMTFTDASTYGLDGFQFDVPDNEGVLEGPARLPETKGLSGLPDGVIQGQQQEDVDLRAITETEDGFNLTSMLDESDITTEEQRKEASLADLDWLDPTKPQDPERLPDQEDTLDTIPTLEEAWGVDRRTDGVHLIPNKDLDAARYQESLSEAQPHSDLPGNKNAAELREAAFSIVRRAHYGKSLKALKQELVSRFGREAKVFRKLMAQLEREKGLLGKVYIRASAFPGLKNGYGVKELRRACMSCRYVITDDETIASKLGMEAVTDVPWKKALRHYAPRLKAAGYIVPESDSARKALKSAFLAGPVEKIPEPTLKPQGIVMAKAPEVVDDGTPVVSSEKQATDRKMRAALVQIAKWVKADKLSQEDALRLREYGQQDSIRPESLLKAASALVVASKGVPVYEGEGLDKGTQSARQAAWSSLEEQQAEVEVALFKKAQVKLAKAVKAGQLTHKEAQRLVKRASSASELSSRMAAAIQAAQEMRSFDVEFEETAEYKGTPQKAAPVASTHIPEIDAWTKRAMDAVQGTDHKAGEVLGLVRWARMQMSEGKAGENLDLLLKARFSSGLLEVSSNMLDDVRVAHEGLSGHLYVDAAAYASPKGLTGCEKGSLKHRANQLKTVLAMDRCASCVHKNADGVCSLYNKRLVDTVPTPDPESYQKEAIRLANAPDNEVTASLFNPSEFDLRAPDEVDLDPDVTAETLSDVLFGGLEL